MFEDELGDDFLTSWKPTKMDVDVDLDLHQVSGPKSAVRTKFASSKMDLDFDFDGGFNKLSSFDIDLSFNSPTCPAKKAMQTDLPEKPTALGSNVPLVSPVRNENEAGSTDIFQAPTGIESVSPKSCGPAIAALSLKSFKETQKECAEAACTSNKRSAALPCVTLEERSSDSISMHASAGSIKTPQILPGDHVERKQIMTLGSNVPPLSPAASEKEAGSTDIFQSPTGLETDSPKKGRPATAALPLNNFEETQKEGSGDPCTSDFNKGSEALLCLTLEEMSSDRTSTHAPAVSSKTAQMLRGDHVEVEQSMALGSNVPPVTLVASEEEAGNMDIFLSPTGLESDSSKLCRPASPALPLNNFEETRKKGAEAAVSSAFNKSSAALPRVTLEEKSRDGTSPHAPAVSSKTAQILLRDQAEGKQSMAREDPSLGQLKSKTAPTLGNSGTTINTIPNQNKHKLGASKRPSREISGTRNQLQSGLRRSFPIHLEEDQGDSCRGVRVSEKTERQQIVRHNVAGFPTALAPADGIPLGIRQGLEVQKSITNTVKAQNELSSRLLITSRYFATDVPTSTKKENGQQIHTPRPDLGKSSRLISSAKCPVRPLTQPNLLVGNKNEVRKISGTSEDGRSKILQTNSSSRDTEVRASGNNTEKLARPQSLCSGRTPLQTFAGLKPLAEGHRVQADRRCRQKRPSLECVEDQVPYREVHNQNLPISTGTQVGQLPAHCSADLLISENNDVVELSIQQSDKLDTMLKTLKKLNDDAKDLLVRALVTNNQLMMLDSPVTEFIKIEKSVMEAVGTDCRD